MDENVQAVVKEVEKYRYGLKMLDEKSYRNVITYILITMLCEKSTETEKHARRMVIYSELIGKKLQLSSKEKDELSLLAALHDIGKICINPFILHKPSKLTSSEWDEMRRHSEIGYQIAKMVPELDSIAEFILYHHERWDGEGYPHGLKGEDIPLDRKSVV
jgi:HD-GYP domain-containing protein (c-di-GMP phosphodiesterase class II)